MQSLLALFFYLLAINIVALGSSSVTYVLASLFGIGVEYNPIMRFVFSKVGLTNGLIIKHIYLTIIATIIFYLAKKYNVDWILWIFFTMVTIDTVICFCALLSLYAN